MIMSCSNCLILAAVFQVIFGHDPRINYTKLAPDTYMDLYRPYENHVLKHCWHPPRGMYLNKCCPKTRLYSDEVMKRGIEPKKKNVINEIANSTPKRIRNMLRECQQDPVVIHKCSPNPDVMYRLCCVFPPFFTREIAKECGGAVLMQFVDEKHSVSGFTRISFDCDQWACILDKYGLLNEENPTILDIDKYFGHLDVWVSLNPIFADVMLEAKIFCKDAFRPIFPLPVCALFNFQECIRNYINVDCPMYIPSAECDEKKEFLKHCKQYFRSKK